MRDKNLKRSYSFFSSQRLSLDMCFTHLYVNKCTSKICIFIARFEGCGYSFVYLIYIYITYGEKWFSKVNENNPFPGKGNQIEKYTLVSEEV